TARRGARRKEDGAGPLRGRAGEPHRPRVMRMRRRDGPCRDREIRAGPASSQTLACAEVFHLGTGRSPSQSPPVVVGTASGRPEAIADDEREGEVGSAQSSREASERSGLGCGGARGAKGRGQGECGTAKHGPDAEPGSRVTGAVPHTRSRHQEQTGQANGALASSQRRCFAGELLRAEEVSPRPASTK